MNEFDIELEYEYRWERYRYRGDWSCAIFLRIPPGCHFTIGIQVFGHCIYWGKMLKKPPFPTTFTNWK
jgi:hypothetical protein